MDKDKFAALVAEIVENTNRIKHCRRHDFRHVQEWCIGLKQVCLNCGGKMDLVSIGTYVSGYEAAGGNPGDIIKDYHGKGKIDAGALAGYNSSIN